jgi:hypothetical protein
MQQPQQSNKSDEENEGYIEFLNLLQQDDEVAAQWQKKKEPTTTTEDSSLSVMLPMLLITEEEEEEKVQEVATGRIGEDVVMQRNRNSSTNIKGLTTTATETAALDTTIPGEYETNKVIKCTYYIPEFRSSSRYYVQE